MLLSLCLVAICCCGAKGAAVRDGAELVESPPTAYEGYGPAEMLPEGPITASLKIAGIGL